MEGISSREKEMEGPGSYPLHYVAYVSEAIVTLVTILLVRFAV